jgi:glucokinase
MAASISRAASCPSWDPPSRPRFEVNGRFNGYLAAIPVYVITHHALALLGATKLVEKLA